MGARRDARRAAQLVSELGLRTSPNRVVRTLMFTDIVDSTRVAERLGYEAWDELLQWHDETLRSLFAGYLGREVKQQGDGFFVAFFEPASAIECARAIQLKLSEDRSRNAIIRVRIGLHATEATEVGDDFRGLGVNIASRITDLAGAGEIVASVGTIEGTDLAIEGDPLTVQVKGVTAPIVIARIAWSNGEHENGEGPGR
jgi:class 3 adenylate cyclase